ncbi:MAG: RNA polymerase sigma factor [Eubacterium sp.]|uniref:RNA polymerase sigma factor n=1 Tax=Eubacterium sp. TaxID=142586 RepID=UPI003A1A3A8A
MVVFLDLLDTEEEKASFQNIYDKYKSLVYWIAYDKLRNDALSEECVQETFIYVALNFEKFLKTENESQLRGFLCTVAKGKAISIFRKENVHNTRELSYENYEELQQTETFDNYTTVEISFAVDKLPEDLKSIVYLKYVYGLNSKEIGEVLNMKDALVRKKLQSAKAKLRNILSDGVSENEQSSKSM